MKSNRSNKFTTGITCTFNSDPNLRFFLFEIDSNNHDDRSRIINCYLLHHLDLLIHRTHMGLHFISPTVITKAQWKQYHQELKEINPKCPMTTLRIEPNKYPNEGDIWYQNTIFASGLNTINNSKRMCDYLNRIFQSDLRGVLDGTIGIVNYPLPLMEQEVL